jgi:uncharacterized protein
MIHFRLKTLITALTVGFCFAIPAYSIDCSNASSAIDKIICASPKLLIRDDELNRAYANAMRQRDSDDRVDLQASQRRWLLGLKRYVEQDMSNSKHHEGKIDYEYKTRIVSLKTPYNDVAKKLALDLAKLNKTEKFKEWNDTSLTQVGVTWIKQNEIEYRDFIRKLPTILDNKEVGNKLFAWFEGATFGGNALALDINGDGVVDYRVRHVAGTMQCVDTRYFVSNKENAGKYDLLDFSPETFCAADNSQVSGDLNDVEFQGKHYAMAINNASGVVTYDFFDVLALPISVSRLIVMRGDRNPHAFSFIDDAVGADPHANRLTPSNDDP